MHRITLSPSPRLSYDGSVSPSLPPPCQRNCVTRAGTSRRRSGSISRGRRPPERNVSQRGRCPGHGHGTFLPLPPARRRPVPRAQHLPRPLPRRRQVINTGATRAALTSQPQRRFTLSSCGGRGAVCQRRRHPGRREAPYQHVQRVVGHTSAGHSQPVT